MASKLNCRQINTRIQAIYDRKLLFDEVFSNGDYSNCLKLKEMIVEMIGELSHILWDLERLSYQEIEKQYDQWTEAYRDLSSEYVLPAKVSILRFLAQDMEFMELMKDKEKEGFLTMNLTPAPGFYSIKDLLDKIEQKVADCGGNKKNFYSKNWKEMLEKESDIHYFGTIDQKSLTFDGVTADEIKQNPGKYGILDGWIISFTSQEEDKKDVWGNDMGRFPRPRQPKDYYENYFSDKDQKYMGEKPIIPQEYLSLFMKNLYEKCIKSGESISSKSSDFIGNIPIWFISTYLQNQGTLPAAYWFSTISQLGFTESGTGSKGDGKLHCIRSVVRRTKKP